jgi:hypothetical protein
VNELSALACTLGDVFAESAAVNRFAAETQAARQMGAAAPHHNLLSMLAVSGPFPAQPLLLGWWAPLTPEGLALRPLPSAAQFLADAPRVAAAFLTTIEWLRSWLPGYPLRFRLPHVDPLASRVIQLGFPNALLPWALQMRRGGIQFVSDISEQIAQGLEIPPSRLRPVLVELRAALWRSPEWQAFRAAHAALDEESKQRLDELVTEFRRDARAAEETSERLMGVETSRRAALQAAEEKAAADQRLAPYYRAFRSIDRTIEGIGAAISQFAMKEGLPSIRPYRCVWVEDEERQVRFAVANTPFLPRINSLAYLENSTPWLRRLVRVEGTTVNFDRHLGEQVLATAVTIEHGSSAGHDVSLAETESILSKILRNP